MQREAVFAEMGVAVKEDGTYIFLSPNSYLCIPNYVYLLSCMERMQIL